MFARLHHSSSPKAIVAILILVDLGRNTVAFPAELEGLALTTNNSSQIQTKRKNKKQCSPKSKERKSPKGSPSQRL
jgi:hypothetical protein